jgi:hypothetical protein
MSPQEGGGFGGDLSSDDDADFERFAELMWERQRVCHAVAATPANSMESLTTKKAIVCEIAREQGSSETARVLIASFLEDFDRLFAEDSTTQERRQRVLGENAADELIGEICDMFWDLIRKLGESASEDIGTAALCTTSGVGENDAPPLRELGTVLSGIVDNAAVSNQGLIKKRGVLEAWLQLDLALCQEPTLLNSFFRDFDRVVAAYCPDTRRSFSIGDAVVALSFYRSF